MGDARRALMFQAHITGAVDFSRARLRDPRWWRYLEAVLAALSQTNGRTVLGHMVQYNLAKSQATWLPEKTKLESAKEALQRIVQIADSYEGTAPRSEAQQRKDEAQQLHDAWSSVFGDPNDPEVAARIEATAKALEN